MGRVFFNKMPSVSQTYSRDGNRVPITTYGFATTKSSTLSASNTTASNSLFSITGTVLVKSLYGIVTTVLSSNITAAYWEINDQTASPDITLSSGTALSSFAVGSVLLRRSVASVALTGTNSSAGAVLDPVDATAPDLFMPFAVEQKTASVLTTIDFTYSTTNTPATGVIKFYAGWLPMSDDGNLVAV
jgi:hypothetical protein